MHKKSWIVFSVIAVLFTGLLGQLWYIIKTNPAQVASTQNQWTVSVADTRGTIYDRNLIPFVNEVYEYRAAIAPSGTLLAHIRKATDEESFNAARNQLISGAPATVCLTEAVDLVEGIKLFWVPRRHAANLLAPHIIGYLDNSGQSGIYGIEKGYDEVLSSYKGKATVSFAVDGSGHYLAGIQPTIKDTTTRSQGGIALTLDKQVQAIVEEIGCQYLPKGAVVILKPDTGEVLSMASFPSFQPNTVADSIASGDGALLNRALSLYDCGSVFKIVTTAAALESGIPISRELTCDGYLDVEGNRFHCHNRIGHGQLAMTEAFAQSCNLYYIQLAQQIGAEAVFSMAQSLRMDKSISPAESLSVKASLLPSLSTITVSKAALANLSFGQGYLMTSPLHIAQITATIANDGIVKQPTLIYGTVDENNDLSTKKEGRGERVFSKKTAEQLQNMMKNAVYHGTGSAATPSADITAAGKTGTAETGQINQNGDRVIQSWFTGYFPAENPQFVVTVLAEDAENTDTKSTIIFQKIANGLANLVN